MFEELFVKEKYKQNTALPIKFVMIIKWHYPE